MATAAPTPTATKEQGYFKNVLEMARAASLATHCAAGSAAAAGPRARQALRMLRSAEALCRTAAAALSAAPSEAPAGHGGQVHAKPPAPQQQSGAGTSRSARRRRRAREAKATGNGAALDGGVSGDLGSAGMMQLEDTTSVDAATAAPAASAAGIADAEPAVDLELDFYYAALAALRSGVTIEGLRSAQRAAELEYSRVGAT